MRNARKSERKLQNEKNIASHCPLCNKMGPGRLAVKPVSATGDRFPIALNLDANANYYVHCSERKSWLTVVQVSSTSKVV